MIGQATDKINILRRQFGGIIAELVDQDERIHVISGDIGYRVFDQFRK
jgi:hypothetical protein